MRDKLATNEKQLQINKAELVQTKQERQEVYLKKKSYVSFEGFMILVGIIYVFNKNLYSIFAPTNVISKVLNACAG